MSKNDFEKLKSLFIPQLEAKNKALENNLRIRKSQELHDQVNKDKTKQLLIDHNKKVLSSSGITELFENIKCEQLIGSDTTIENSEDWSHLYLKWNFVTGTGETDSGMEFSYTECKKVVAVVENSDIYIGSSKWFGGNDMKRVRWGDFVNLVCNALLEAQPMDTNTPINRI